MFSAPPPYTRGGREKETERDDSITHNPLPLPGDALHTEWCEVEKKGFGFGGCLFAGGPAVRQYET